LQSGSALLHSQLCSWLYSQSYSRLRIKLPSQLRRLGRVRDMLTLRPNWKLGEFAKLNEIERFQDSKIQFLGLANGH